MDGDLQEMVKVVIMLGCMVSPKPAGDAMQMLSPLAKSQNLINPCLQRLPSYDF